ncbi:MAG TPA: amino acid adenylation domain-containing protein [Terriglobales bacterium]|nr:amino acid adenylation domain-containing protein [Terriglobales bacterium]
MQYADYAVWQRQYLAGGTLDRQLEYWKQQLAGAPPTLDLPTDRPRPPIQTFHGAKQSTLVPPDVLDGLKKLSRQQGVTFFMTALAAFNLLLARYSGQNDIVVGSAIAGRNRSEIEKLIGFFVNTLALRTDLSGNPTFSNLLQRVRMAAMGAYAHQDLPFEKLVEELSPVRDMSRNPLFQVMLILQNVPTAGQEMGNVRVGSFPVAGETSKFDLTLILLETRDGLRATFEYNTDLFDAATIGRMLEHFQILLQAIAEDAGRTIADLPLLSPDERQELLVDWNSTKAPIPQCSLPELFAAQARKRPHHVAVDFGDRQITYEELHARSNQLARYLSKQGVGPEILVGLCLERSVDMVVALLGVLKAGGAYVPLDPSYPKDRIAFILEDAKAPLLLTDSSLANAVPANTTKMVCLDADWDAVAEESAEDFPSPITPRNLAYVLYTSGSTGKPKGVEIEHRNLVNFLLSMQRTPGISEQDTLLAVTTLSFDIAGLELYLPLVSGAKIALAFREEAADGEQLLKRLQASKATLMQATPATWRMLLEAGWQGTPSLRVLCGGEALPPDLANQLLPRCAQLWNMYGPTETTIWSTLYRVKSPLACVAPIGRPVANTALYVLDAQRQPVPIGAAGELYIGGDGVARGYLNHPELTAERFVPDPFRHFEGSRLYRTGDLARYLPDGNLEYLGRTDFQVKVRGFRIELGEIEAALSQHSCVQQAVVTVREDIPGDQRLVGYIVPTKGDNPATGELRSFLRESLPEYMVPGIFVALDSLPLTPNGKINRKALPPPQAVVEEDLALPRTEIEKAIAEIWEGVLHISEIGIHSNFFELGGHSLLATQVVSRIQNRLGAHVPLRSLFEHPTISELAKEISMPKAPDTRVRELNIPQLPRDRVAQQSFPLSFAQQRLWVLDQLEPNSPAYNVPISLRLNGILDISALEQAINEVLLRHEILRIEIHSENGEPMQRVLPHQPLKLAVVDLSKKPATEREERALRLAGEEARKPFHLAHGPLIRSKVLRVGEEDFVLLITVHHIVFDGWSAGTFLHEMAMHYEAARGGESLRLPDLPVQYVDFAAWQRKTLEGHALEQELSYWREALAGAPASIDVPTDRPRPPMQTFRGRARTEIFGRPLLERLEEISRLHGVTPFMTLLAAFDILLQRYSGQDDVVVGTPIAGRNYPEVEKLIGLFVNTLVLRMDLSGNPTFVELLRRAKKTAMGAYAHQEVPFERLVEELKPERDLSRNPLFQVLFALQNLPREEWKMHGLTPVPFQVEGGSEKFDLSVTLVERANGLKATFGYNTDLFDEATVIRLMGHFRRLLEAIAADPEQRIADLPLLTESEERKLLVEFNSTTAEYPRTASVVTLFEAQAGKTPNAVAMVFRDEQLSYRQLNERANRIAHHLRKAGVGPDVLVGIYVERSLDMVAGILGILKAGGAYVPLDPAYPRDRIGFILENAQAPVLLTQQALVDTLPAHRARVVCLDRDWETIAREGIRNPDGPRSPADLAYVLYTSGSTGKPKGVQIEHRNLVNFLISMSSEPGLKPADTLLAVTTLSFDIAGLELYLPLITGARVVLASREQAADGRELIALLERSRATVLQATPATWRMLIESGWKGSSHLKVLCGGEALPADLADQLLSRCAELWNMYGPTETTIWSSVYRVTSTLANTAPIGTPIANTAMYVLDGRKRPVPIGVPGELYIGGDGVARGYLNRPDLTAEKFQADPFRRGERIYRTGDLAKYLADGNIQFLGRADFQVKVRGFRIELEEIESVLAQHPGVQQGVVIVREDRPGDKRLVGYIIPKPGEDPGTASLREHLKGSLPEYMVPGIFVKLDSLPLTPNGKVNRRALPSPDWSQMESLGSVAARDQLELMLVKIWQKVLGLPQIGITDNFFDLGGHSLLAARLLAEVEKVTGRQIPLSALFRGATVESLAQILREGSEASPDPVVMEIQAGNGGLPFFAVASPGVDTLGYALLARHMGADQPLYKLQAQEPVVERRPFTEDELRQLSQEYIAAMRAVQPQGPYCFGGMCEGVQIAERMIWELEAQGQKVGLFAIFDTWVLQHSQDPWRWRLYYYQQRLRSLRRARLGEQLQTYGRVARNKIGNVTGRIPARTDWQEAYWPQNFVPRRFRAPIALFKRPKQPFYYVDDPQMGWGARSESGVEIYEIDFHHLEILREPYVRILGQKLAACMDRVLETNGHSPRPKGEDRENSAGPGERTY